MCKAWIRGFLAETIDLTSNNPDEEAVLTITGCIFLPSLYLHFFKPWFIKFVGP